MTRIRFAVPLFAAFVGAGAFAQSTYHVAPPASGGSDSHPGTEALPWATLQYAANRVGPGDTVIVHAGTYVGFNVGTSGTPGAPITFRALDGVLVNIEAARFNGTTHRARINLDTVSHIVIDGFEVTGTNDQRNSKAGIRIVAPPGSSEDEAGFITIRNCHVHHNGEWGVLSGHVHRITVEDSIFHDQYDEHGVYLGNSADNHVVRNNVIYNNSSQGFHCNSDASQGGDGVITGVLVENNIIYNNAIGSVYIDGNGVQRTSTGGGSAINFDGVRDSVIRNNVLYNNHASGISLYRIDGLLSSANNVVVNNTIINGSTANPATRWCLNISDGSTGNVVFNNIFLNYHSFRGSIFITTDSRPGFTSDFNIVMDRLAPDGDDGPVVSLATWRAATGQDTHSVSMPAGTWGSLFEDLGTWDLRVREGSAAEDAGTGMLGGVGAPLVDVLGVTRPQGESHDVGAYERASGVACPADFNGDGDVTSQDFFDFLGAFFSGLPQADFNDDGAVNSQDFFDFLGAFFEGCG